MKTIGYERMQSVTKKWQEKYPNAMRRWEENWDVLSPMFKFSAEVRKVMYTTNAIESLNSVLHFDNTDCHCVHIRHSLNVHPVQLPSFPE